jgi:hypothetical protein
MVIENRSLIGSLSYQQIADLRPLRTPNEIAQKFYSNDQTNINYLRNITKIFPSDYAVYWFDYPAGYAVLLAQLGWNNSLTQNIALVRGAANLQNKEWGAVLTWKYNYPPYLGSREELFDQMSTAYTCGAKYIILFNYYQNDDNPYGTMQEEHFLALQEFWNSTQNSTNLNNSVKAETALVLPKDFACGMRWKGDNIWGVLKSNETADQIWEILQTTLTEKGLQLDIVYDDPEFFSPTQYREVIYWNQITPN